MQLFMLALAILLLTVIGGKRHVDTTNRNATVVIQKEKMEEKEITDAEQAYSDNDFIFSCAIDLYDF